MDKHKAKSEEETKAAILDKIHKRQEENENTIEIAIKRGKKVGIQEELYDIAQIVEEKLNELEQQFQQVGLNLYSNSLVTEAIMQQLNKYLLRGEELLNQYNRLLTPVYSKVIKANTEEQDLEPRKQNYFSNLFNKVKNACQKYIPKKKMVTPEALQSAHTHLRWYKNLGNLANNYNLREKIVSNLVELICPSGKMMQLEDTIPPMVLEEIAPILSELGLGDLIPELERKITEEYKKEGIDISQHFKLYKEKSSMSGSIPEPKSNSAINSQENQMPDRPTEGIEQGED